jgi:small nuclear ribonucleoprotein (snRNP)-like protein
VSRVLRARLRERVLVTTKDGAAFAGVLYAEDGKALVLRNAEALGAADDKSNVPLDGEVIVLLPDVAFIQRP